MGGASGGEGSVGKKLGGWVDGMKEGDKWEEEREERDRGTGGEGEGELYPSVDPLILEKYRYAVLQKCRCKF